jgi:hypothetical protein
MKRTVLLAIFLCALLNIARAQELDYSTFKKIELRIPMKTLQVYCGKAIPQLIGTYQIHPRQELREVYCLKVDSNTFGFNYAIFIFDKENDMLDQKLLANQINFNFEVNTN